MNNSLRFFALMIVSSIFAAIVMSAPMIFIITLTYFEGRGGGFISIIPSNNNLILLLSCSFSFGIIQGLFAFLLNQKSKSKTVLKSIGNSILSSELLLILVVFAGFLVILLFTTNSSQVRITVLLNWFMILSLVVFIPSVLNGIVLNGLKELSENKDA